MSYDLKLINGDIGFGVDGNPIIVQDSAKLQQDIAKTIQTPQGTDPGSVQYGTKLKGILGQRFDFSVIQGLASKTVAEAMNFLQSLQYVQATKQDLSYLETIGSVDAINVIQGSGFGKIEIRLMVTTVGGLREIYSYRLGE